MLWQIVTSSGQRKRYAVCAIIAFLVVVTFVVYAQVVTHQFITFDDPLYIVNNPNIRNGLTLHGVMWAFSTVYASNWHPLTWLSHMLDVQLFGLQPAGHMFVNLLWHTAATLLLFALLQRLSGKIWQSAVVAALFALHPLHVESVAWASERKDVLSGAFWMLTLICYARYTTQPDPLRYVMTFVCLALGLMAKSMLVTLPLVMLIIDFWPLDRFAAMPLTTSATVRRESWWHLLREKIPFLLLSVASGVITMYAQQQAIATLEVTPVLSRIANALVAYLTYLYQMMIPLDLIPYYPYSHDLPLWQGGIAFVVLVTITVVVFQQRRNRPYLIAGWCWYLCTLIPVIGIVQVGAQRTADRYTYIPLIGIFIMLVWGGVDLSRQWVNRKTLSAGIVIVLVSVCATISWRQVAYWQDAETLFGHVLEVDPANYMAHFALGLAQAKAGKLDEAILSYEKALSHAPWLPGPHLELGKIYSYKGATNKAVLMFDQAIKIAPDSFDGYYHQGILLAEIGQPEEAIASFSRAIGISPHDADAHSRIALVYQQINRLDDAVQHYTVALTIAPQSAFAHANLGGVLLAQGKLEAAMVHYVAATQSDPNSPITHHNLAVVLQQLKRLDESVDHYRKALAIDPSLAKSHNNLGIVLAEQGQMVDAIRHFDLALKIKPDYDEARRNRAFALTTQKNR